jgi:hypothetical protein
MMHKSVIKKKKQLLLLLENCDVHFSQRHRKLAQLKGLNFHFDSMFKHFIENKICDNWLFQLYMGQYV